MLMHKKSALSELLCASLMWHHIYRISQQKLRTVILPLKVVLAKNWD